MKTGRFCLRMVVNVPVISLGATAEHTRACDDKQDCPVPSEYHTNISQINPILPQALFTCLKTRAINVQTSSRIPPFQPLLTIPPRGLGRVPRGLKISLNHLILSRPDCNKYKCHGRKIPSSTRGPVTRSCSISCKTSTVS